MVELLIGANDNEDAAHPVQLMDFAARRYLNNWRGKRGQQVWVPGVGTAAVKRVKPKPRGKFEREQVKAAIGELADLLARLMGEPMQSMVNDMFEFLDALFIKYRRDRHVVDWTYLASVGDLMLCRWCEELRKWVRSGARWEPNESSREFAMSHRLAEEMPVLVVPMDSAWYVANVEDVLYQLLKHGKQHADKWLKAMRGAGATDEAFGSGSEGWRWALEVEKEQELERQSRNGGIHQEFCPPLGWCGSVAGVEYEVLELDVVDPDDEGCSLLPAGGGQPERVMAPRQVRFCTDHRRGACTLGKECPKSHDPALMRLENEATAGKPCHAFAKDGSCRFGKNCRFSHSASDFR